MATARSLQGACSCGRIRYTITIPPNNQDDRVAPPRRLPSDAQVTFSTSAHDRRTQATPLAAWLRIPLTWYASSTHAYAPDETHATIRRTYVPARREAERRCFCAHCGTHLSCWTDDPPSEKEWIAVTLGSLAGSDLDDLEELGLLPGIAGTEEAALGGRSPLRKTDQAEAMVTWSWFESMVRGTGLGKLTKRTTVSDGDRTTVEWEVVEWADDLEQNNGNPGKRKRLKGNEDVDSA
ncbi:MAG: hypothetical protein M1814_003822 [Vezdaea aestivalis]|nr:MAG: hypothetical protein M1814_003822 [Vezdaea aestivalis]